MNLRGSELEAQEELLRERVGWKLCKYGAHIWNYQKWQSICKEKIFLKGKKWSPGTEVDPSEFSRYKWGSVVITSCWSATGYRLLLEKALLRAHNFLQKNLIAEPVFQQKFSGLYSKKEIFSTPRKGTSRSHVCHGKVSWEDSESETTIFTQ